MHTRKASANRETRPISEKEGPKKVALHRLTIPGEARPAVTAISVARNTTSAPRKSSLIPSHLWSQQHRSTFLFSLVMTRARLPVVISMPTRDIYKSFLCRRFWGTAIRSIIHTFVTACTNFAYVFHLHGLRCERAASRWGKEQLLARIGN